MNSATNANTLMDAIKANTQSKMTSFKAPAMKQNSQSAVQKKEKKQRL